MKKPRPIPPWLGAMASGSGAALLFLRPLRPLLPGAAAATEAAIWAARARRALPCGRLVT